MKVGDFMQKDPVTMKSDQPIRHALRLIYNLGIGSVVITTGKKLVGIITEEDIMHRLFPSINEFMEDQVRGRNYDLMEEKLVAMSGKPVSAIMTRDVTTVNKNTPLMKVLSIMLVNNFSHVPVVSDKNNLEGLITQGDIFRALAGSEIPYDNEEEYHDWLAHHWDLVQRSRDRYTVEATSLKPLLTKHKVQTILDIGCGTGGHDTSLARYGYSVIGLDKSSRMIKTALTKLGEENKSIQNLVLFRQIKDYSESIAQLKTEIDAVLFLGNALAHTPQTYEEDLGTIAKYLRPGGLLIAQIVNAHKVMEVNRRLQDFNIASSSTTPGKEYAFIEYYDPVPVHGRFLTLNMAVLSHDQHRWQNSSINSTPVANITMSEFKKLLSQLKFSKIDITGSNHGESLFGQTFDIEKHDWMNVVAVK